MPKRFKTRGIKTNKSYQLGELADVAGVSTATVRNWIRAGMQRVDSNRPTMIMGFQALEYLNDRKTSSKHPMALGEFYCLRCKTPRTPLGAMADYVPASDTGGRLKAFCGVCECPCNRNISANQLPAFARVLDVEIRGSE